MDDAPILINGNRFPIILLTHPRLLRIPLFLAPIYIYTYISWIPILNRISLNFLCSGKSCFPIRILQNSNVVEWSRHTLPLPRPTLTMTPFRKVSFERTRSITKQISKQQVIAVARSSSSHSPLDLSRNEQPRFSVSIRLKSRQAVLHSLAAVILGRGGLDNRAFRD